VIGVLRSIDAKDHRRAAHRIGQFASRVFRFALQMSYSGVNPVADLREVLKPRKSSRMPDTPMPRTSGN
jgi:hypothetical protein